MTEQEAIHKLDQLDSGDPETAHLDADQVLLDFLTARGHDDLVKAFDSACRRVPFWYA